MTWPDPMPTAGRHDARPKPITHPAPHVIVLFGATGDLAKRKLLPGMLHLFGAGLLPDFRIVATARTALTDEQFRAMARAACEASSRPVSPQVWEEFAQRLSYVCLDRGTQGLAAAVARAEQLLPADAERLHYLSVPPQAALSVVQSLAEAELVERARIVLEKPFGTDLSSARALNSALHETFEEDQIFRIDHFLGKEAALNILAFRFANGLFEPIWNRNHISHIQIDVPESIGIEMRASFYEGVGAYRDMVVTHLFQVLAFMAMEPPVALEPSAIREEKNKVFKSMRPVMPNDVVRGQYNGYREQDGVAPYSETETFIAMRAEIDNWRWAGVPFYLRTGKQMAESARIISIAFHEPPRSMFPPGSGVGTLGPDHLTFDLADHSRLSLSFYGKRPGPGMRLEKLSMQFSVSETERPDDALQAYERLIIDAMCGDQTLFTSAVGIERLWEVSAPLLEAPPQVRPYSVGSYGPNAIHQLIAPNAWRLPFERSWRQSTSSRAHGDLDRSV